MCRKSPCLLDGNGCTTWGIGNDFTLSNVATQLYIDWSFLCWPNWADNKSFICIWTPHWPELYIAGLLNWHSIDMFYVLRIYWYIRSWCNVSIARLHLNNWLRQVISSILYNIREVTTNERKVVGVRDESEAIKISRS